MTLARRTPKLGASASKTLAHAKGPTKAETRAARPKPSPGRRRPATGLQKPQPGHHQRTSRKQEAITLLKKTEAKVRDYFRCQVPGCEVQGREHVEACHLENSGAGGRFSVSSQRKHFVAGCHDHHQGRKSLHTTHLMVKPMTADGADGPLAWYARDRVGNVWGAYQLLGISRPLPVVVRS